MYNVELKPVALSELEKLIDNNYPRLTTVYPLN